MGKGSRHEKKKDETKKKESNKRLQNHDEQKTKCKIKKN